MIQKALSLGKTSKEKAIDEIYTQKKEEPSRPLEDAPVSPKTIFRVRGYDEYNDGFKEELYDEFYSNQNEARKAFDRYVDAWFNSREHVSPDDWNFVDTVCFSSVSPGERKLSVFCGLEEDSISYYIELSAITLN